MLLASHYFRSVGIPCSLYIDDRHCSFLRLPSVQDLPIFQAACPDRVSYLLAQSACFVVCCTLIGLGYTLGLQKSSLVPSKCVKYLGFECDSHSQAFRLIPKKKQAFIDLTESVLSSTQVSLNPLQKLSGKCVSMAMAVPGARLFTNEMNLAISKGCRSSRPVQMTKALRSEIENWLFLRSWSGFLPWRSERHLQFRLYAGGDGVLNPAEIAIKASDYWSTSVFSSSIVAKETLALANALDSFSSTIANSRIDVFVDNIALIHAWNSQGARSHKLSDALKAIFQVTIASNCVLNLIYVQSYLSPILQMRRHVCCHFSMRASPLARGRRYSLHLVVCRVIPSISWRFILMLCSPRTLPPFLSSLLIQYQVLWGLTCLASVHV